MNVSLYNSVPLPLIDSVNRITPHPNCFNVFVDSIRRCCQSAEISRTINMTGINKQELLATPSSDIMTSINTYESLNVTSSFGGIDYPLKKIDKKTPIIFQWFVCNNSSFKDNEIPIINTKSNPYLDNIIAAAKIEKERIIGIFIGGDITDAQRAECLKLEIIYSNVKIIFKDDLDFSMYDKKIVDIITHQIECTNKNEVRFLHELNEILKRTLVTNKEQTLLSKLDDEKDHSWFDFYRNLIVMKGSSAFFEAKKQGCESLLFNGGCIYLDCDMVLTNKIGSVYLPNGIGVHVKKTNEGLSLENGIIAVDRSKHPALIEGLKIMHSDICANPYYDGLCKGLTNHFNFNGNSEYEEFCLFIEFKSKSINMDTSKLTASSWRA